MGGSILLRERFHTCAILQHQHGYHIILPLARKAPLAKTVCMIGKNILDPPVYPEVKPVMYP